MKDKITELITQYDNGGFTKEELEWELLNLYNVINWVTPEERTPTESDTYLVKNKYHLTAEYHEHNNKWTVFNEDGFEVEITIDKWKPIT